MHGKLDAFGGKVMIVWLALALGAAPALSEELSSRTNTAELKASADLRPLFDKWGLACRQQGGRPTCSVFTVAGALEFALAKSHPPGERLSVEFLNWAANQKAGDAYDGGFFSSLWDGFATYGICKERNMPYQASFDPTRKPDAQVVTEAKSRLSLGLSRHWIKQWNVNTGLTVAELLSVKRTLHEGWPVCGGFRWPKQEDWQEAVLLMCPPEAVFDGHSVLLVGYRDDAAQPGGGVFILRNTSRGGEDGSMPYAYAQAYMNDAMWIETGSNQSPVGPSSATVPPSSGK